MKKMRPNTAKILVHSEGLGTPHVGLVRQRAEELAIINGHARYTQEDWRQAKIELHGGHGPDGELTDEMAVTVFASERDMLAADVGHHADRLTMEDERNVVEELWQEGMEEAEHERMLASRVEERQQDGEDAD